MTRGLGFSYDIVHVKCAQCASPIGRVRHPTPKEGWREVRERTGLLLILFRGNVPNLANLMRTGGFFCHKGSGLWTRDANTNAHDAMPRLSRLHVEAIDFCHKEYRRCRPGATVYSFFWIVTPDGESGRRILQSRDPPPPPLPRGGSSMIIQGRYISILNVVTS
eukprot:jgi/Botrbrau1/22140/Bobra.0206s0064.1